MGLRITLPWVWAPNLGWTGLGMVSCEWLPGQVGVVGVVGLASSFLTSFFLSEVNMMSCGFKLEIRNQ